MGGVKGTRYLLKIWHHAPRATHHAPRTTGHAPRKPKTVSLCFSSKKAVSHIINSRAFPGEKPCINKAIHALLLNGYATFNMIVPGHRFAAVTRFVLPGPRTSPSKLRSRDISEKAKQNSARKNAKCSKCFQFLCNNSNRTWFFNALTFTRSLGRCWKPRPPFSTPPSGHGEC